MSTNDEEIINEILLLLKESPLSKIDDITDYLAQKEKFVSETEIRRIIKKLLEEEKVEQSLVYFRIKNGEVPSVPIRTFSQSELISRIHGFIILPPDASLDLGSIQSELSELSNRIIRLSPSLIEGELGIRLDLNDIIIHAHINQNEFLIRAQSYKRAEIPISDLGHRNFLKDDPKFFVRIPVLAGSYLMFTILKQIITEKCPEALFTVEHFSVPLITTPETKLIIGETIE